MLPEEVVGEIELHGRMGAVARGAVPFLENRLLPDGSYREVARGPSANALRRIQHRAPPEIVKALAWDVGNGSPRWKERWRCQSLVTRRRSGRPLAKRSPRSYG